MRESEKYGKKWLANGMAVAHIDNIELKMRVSHFVFESKEIDGVTAKLFRGVKCTWWGMNKQGDNRVLMDAEFHSKELIPWEVAELGKEEVKYFLNRPFSNVD